MIKPLARVFVPIHAAHIGIRDSMLISTYVACMVHVREEKKTLDSRLTHQPRGFLGQARRGKSDRIHPKGRHKLTSFLSFFFSNSKPAKTSLLIGPPHSTFLIPNTNPATVVTALTFGFFFHHRTPLRLTKKTHFSLSLFSFTYGVVSFPNQDSNFISNKAHETQSGRVNFMLNL